jgi:hypothetical protein
MVKLEEKKWKHSFGKFINFFYLKYDEVEYMDRWYNGYF